MCQSVCAKAVLKEKFTMTILDSVKGTVNTAVDTISSVAQTIVEKNRTNAKLNRLRLVMKSESELMNRLCTTAERKALKLMMPSAKSF